MSICACSLSLQSGSPCKNWYSQRSPSKKVNWEENFSNCIMAGKQKRKYRFLRRDNRIFFPSVVPTTFFAFFDAALAASHFSEAFDSNMLFSKPSTRKLFLLPQTEPVKQAHITSAKPSIITRESISCQLEGYSTLASDWQILSAGTRCVLC